MSTGLVFTKEPNWGYRDFPKDQFLWHLRGPLGVVQFKCGPATPSAHEVNLRFRDISYFDARGWSWQSWDLGYHSYMPTYVGHHAVTDKCDVIEDQPCYYDGTPLGAADLLGKWLKAYQDDVVIEQELHECYDRWLCNDDDTCASNITALSIMLRKATS